MTPSELIDLLRQARATLESVGQVPTGEGNSRARDLHHRIDAALKTQPDDELVFTRFGPQLRDQHGDRWWNEKILQLAQSDKDSIQRVVDIITASARAEDERDAARRDAANLRVALMRVEVDLAGDRTWCRLCRTEARGDGVTRALHPHEADCILYARRLP